MSTEYLLKAQATFFFFNCHSNERLLKVIIVSCAYALGDLKSLKIVVELFLFFFSGLAIQYRSTTMHIHLIVSLIEVLLVRSKEGEN